MEWQRPEADRLAGVIRGQLGQEPVEVPVLAIAQARSWRELAERNVVEVAGAAADTLGDMLQLLSSGDDRVLELVLAYDQLERLGGREAVESRGTSEQLYALLQQMLAASYPFVRDVNQVIGLLVETLGTSLSAPARSPGPASTNGQPAPGVRAPRSSGKRGRTSS